VSDPQTRFTELFHELYVGLPRQGPGNRACAERALALCGELPESPRVLDLGCGVGGQTLQLAALTSGTIVALDALAPAVERLRAAVAERGLAERVQPMVGDMADPGLPPGSFDLVWSEGALYSIGLEPALRECHRLLRPGGRLAFTDAVWRQAEPPAEVKAGFDADYPGMGWLADDLASLGRCGFALLGHFTLPDAAWWDDFYTPMLARVEEMRRRYHGDEEAAAILDALAREPELHRQHSRFYAYEFFVARRE
jgi:SAM-dependent methyltransferase